MRKMLVHVLTRDGRKTLYELDPFGTVGQLKARIGRHMIVPMCFSRLTYKGRLLENHNVLEEVGVKRMSTLHLHWQPLVFTPRQLREREDELDRLEEMMRGGEGQTPEGDDHEGGTLEPGGSATGSKFHLSFITRSCGKLPDTDMEDVTSVSSSELDFLALYRRPKKDKKSDDLTEEETLEPNSLPSNDVLYRPSKGDKKSDDPAEFETLAPKPMAQPSKGPMVQEAQEASEAQPSKQTNRKKNAKKNAKKSRKNK